VAHAPYRSTAAPPYSCRRSGWGAVPSALGDLSRAEATLLRLGSLTSLNAARLVPAIGKRTFPNRHYSALSFSSLILNDRSMSQHKSIVSKKVADDRATTPTVGRQSNSRSAWTDGLRVLCATPAPICKCCGANFICRQAILRCANPAQPQRLVTYEPLSARACVSTRRSPYPRNYRNRRRMPR